MWQQQVKDLTSFQILEHHRFSDEFSLNLKSTQLHLTRRDENCPSNNCEVYMMNLPCDVLMQELHDFMAACGKIYEIRLLMEFSGFCKGNCFVRYFDQLAARKAVLVLSYTDIRPGFNVLIRMSYNNSKLLLLNIPKEVTKEVVLSEVKTRMGHGLKGVELGVADKESGIQCALLSYEHHEQALMVRRTFKGHLSLWNTFIELEWAEPSNNFVKNSVMYFKNLPEKTSKWELFEFLIDAIDIETVVRIEIKQGKGFVVFHCQDDREKGYLRLNNRTLQGRKIDMRCKLKVDSNTNVQDFKPQKQFDNLTKINSEVKIPSFCTAAQHTAPLLAQELDAIIRSVFTFLHQQFPLNSWRLYDPIKELVLPTGLVIRLFVPVNNVKYDFLLAAQ